MFVLVFFVSILMFQILRITVVTFSVPVTWLANLLDSLKPKLKIQKKLFLGPFTSAPQSRQMNCFSQLNSIDRVPHAAAEEADSKN